MAESEKSGGFATALAHAAAAFAHTPFPYLLGMGLMLMGSKWDGHLIEQKGCYQLQEIKGAIYKIDTCTGKTEEIKQEASALNNSSPVSSASTAMSPINQAKNNDKRTQ